MLRFKTSLAALAVMAAIPLTANAFGFGFSDDDFSFGDNNYGPRGEYGPYGPYGPYGSYPRQSQRDSGPRMWGGGPVMQFGDGQEQNAQSQNQSQVPANPAGTANEPSTEQSRSSFGFGGRPWGSNDRWGRSSGEGFNIDQGRTMRFGNSKMDWGNRWRPNFGSGWTPGSSPRWNMYPGWDEYQGGPNAQQRAPMYRAPQGRASQGFPMNRAPQNWTQQPRMPMNRPPMAMPQKPSQIAPQMPGRMSSKMPGFGQASGMPVPAPAVQNPAAKAPMPAQAPAVATSPSANVAPAFSAPVEVKPEAAGSVEAPSPATR